MLKNISIWIFSSLRHGIYKKFFPPASIKLSEISPHISSNVSTQSEENEGAMTAIFSLPDFAKSATRSTVAGPTHFSGPNLD